MQEDRVIRLQQGGAQSDNAADYWRELSTSPFCLAPPGHARWSLRMSEAILAGCVPVLFDVGEPACRKRFLVVPQLTVLASPGLTRQGLGCAAHSR